VAVWLDRARISSEYRDERLGHRNRNAARPALVEPVNATPRTRGCWQSSRPVHRTAGRHLSKPIGHPGGAEVLDRQERATRVASSDELPHDARCRPRGPAGKMPTTACNQGHIPG